VDPFLCALGDADHRRLAYSSDRIDGAFDVLRKDVSARPA
jgi:hypothetical protein